MPSAPPTDRGIPVDNSACADGASSARPRGPTVSGRRYRMTLAAARNALARIYELWTVRQESKAAAPTSVKIIVFGAGNAGTQLVHRLVRQPGAEYRPVAILDDDPGKRRLRIAGVPVAGDRTAMAAVAAGTGARLLVIAIARASGSVIRDLTAQAEACGLIPKVIPSVKELLGGAGRDRRRPRSPDQRTARPAARGDRCRGRRQLFHREADSGDRRRRVYRLRALPPAAPPESGRSSSCWTAMSPPCTPCS